MKQSGAKRHSIQALAREARRRIEDARAREIARELEAEADWDRMWEEDGGEKSPPSGDREQDRISEALLVKASADHETVFVVHSEQKGKPFKGLASEGARLTELLPEESFQGVRGIEGSWLRFERLQGDLPREEGRPEGSHAAADTTAERRERGVGR